MNRQAWDEVLALLNLRTCYQPAVAKVLSEQRWRDTKNPRAYVATAAARAALSMKLLDFTDREFRRVQASDISDRTVTTHQSISPLNGPDIIEDACGGNIYERTSGGALRWVPGDDGDYREIQPWLQRGEEYDSVDWETVAAYAVQKPRMACNLARALIERFEFRTGRPEAVARADGKLAGAELEAAWKWIDRNWTERIAPLFRMETPPRRLTPSDVERFPFLIDEVSIRLDTYIQWDGSTLALVRKGLTPASDGLMPAYGIDASSFEGALRELCNLAAEVAVDGDPLGLFHCWPCDGPATADMLLVRNAIRHVDSKQI
ncbi:MAG: hypothetical protein LLG20_04110 [Acidobacteriales bacterium]|nr:hypothetical protein [Terriglobales bacterium]